jgi:Sporulation and spore germination
MSGIERPRMTASRQERRTSASASGMSAFRPVFSLFNVLALALLVLSSLAFRWVQQPPAPPKAPKLALAEQTAVPMTLFFSDSQVRGYVKQSREVQVTQQTPVVLAQASLKSWVAGPAPVTTGQKVLPAVPRGSDVPTVWLRGEHFVVDLPESYSKFNYGVSGERMLVCSLTRTLLEQRGKDVLFLVGGQNAQTLLGHVDLISPFTREDCADE